MKTLQIYDPAMCCSSGVCGTSVDDALVELAGFLKGIKPEECSVERYNLSQEPAAYVTNQAVKALLDEKGADALPAVFVDNALVSSGSYPAIDELADLLKIDKGESDSESSCCSGGCC